MTARIRLRSHNATQPADFHHAEAQLAAIMHHAAQTHTCLHFGPVQNTHATWALVNWNPAGVRVAGEREVLS